MKALNPLSAPARVPLASGSPLQQTAVEVPSPAGNAGTPQVPGFDTPAGFEAERRRFRSFEEAGRNHVQLSGLLARVRKPLPRMSQRMARAGLRAASAGAARGEFAYRNMLKPLDGALYDMTVHPVKNLLEWNYKNLLAAGVRHPYLPGTWGTGGDPRQPYGQPWSGSSANMPAAYLDGQTRAAQQAPGAYPWQQLAPGFQYAALQFSPFRQGQFQYPPSNSASLATRSALRTGAGVVRRRGLRSADPTLDDALQSFEPQAMDVRRNASQWREVVSQLQEAGMSPADMKEWINDFHDCRRYPCAENHALFNEKYGTLFAGDIGDESLRPAFDALRRAFGMALAPSAMKAGTISLPQESPA